MSKQHLADMLKSITTGDMEAAKAHFNKYSTEKSQEILSRGEQNEVEVADPEVDEPAVASEPTTAEGSAVEVPDAPASEPTATDGTPE